MNLILGITILTALFAKVSCRKIATTKKQFTNSGAIDKSRRWESSKDGKLLFQRRQFETLTQRHIPSAEKK